MLVGDVHQIEPVWGVTPGVDLGNLQNVGLTLEEAQKDKHLPYRASCGSLMQMARRATSVSDGSGGILLTEHRRSVPEIIDYCNRLVYGGRLQPLRPEFDGERVLPAMGWAHITSPTKRRGGSWLNPGEAKVIAEWIGSMRQDLETRYEQSIGEILGVVTPFAAQKWVLINALRDAGLKDVQAGTVHTFQGAERPVILFSSVYSAKSEASSYFFDSGPNMLNVAVSRARDSFLAFGDMRIFRVGGSTPSALLAEHLFASPDNEIVNVESAQHFFGLGEEVRRISGLDDHRRVLDSALATSRERVLIVSPYLTRKAVEADEVMEKVRAATARGVEVRIAWCPGLNQNPGRAKTAHQAVDLLKNAGAVVHGLGQIHSKTLVVDKRWIVEGSFNWLSASRRKGGVWQNHEASLGCSGEGAGELIREAWEEIEAAAKGSLTDR